jgi:hypothetical protein
MKKINTEELMGKKVKDRLTGFTGIMTGRCLYHYKTTEVMIEPTALLNAVPVPGQWFAESRIVEAKEEKKIGYHGKGDR